MWILGILAFWLFVADAALSVGVGGQVLFGRFVAMIMIFALIGLGSAGMMAQNSVALSILIAFGASALLTLATPDPTRGCSEFKCGPLGYQFTGPFHNENTFGTVAVLAIIYALFVGDRILKYSALLAAALVLYFSSSRNSQLAALIILAFVAIWIIQSTNFRRATAIFLPLVPIVFTVLGLYLVYNSSSSAFSNRGGIWRRGVEVLGDSWIVGKGLDTWSTQVLDRNFMHSEYLYLIYSGGSIAVLLWVVMLVTLMWPLATGREHWVLYAVPLYVSLLGLVQLAWNPLAIEQGALIGVAIIGGAFAKGDVAAAIRATVGVRRGTSSRLYSHVELNERVSSG